MIKRIIKNIVNIVTYGCAAITVLLIILSLIGIRPYITISGSMEPNIKTGSVCFVNYGANYEDVEVDDVIAFKAGNTLVTHRVLNFTENGIETKGDNNEDPDSIITNKNNFVGQTLCSIPYAGYAIMFFKTPIGLSIITAILFLLIFANVKDCSKKSKTTPT